MVDIAATLVSNSTQLDNVDLMGGPRVFTITGVTLNEGDQPLSIALAEYGRPWKPGVTMRRLLSEMWGTESDSWIGRKVRLYRDDTVTFGRDKTGGTRISHASHLDKTIKVTLPISKGKFGEFKVDPLTEDAAPTPETSLTSEPPMSDGQRKILHKLVNQLGLTREQKIVGCVAVIQRPIESTSEMTQTEARRVIERLEIKVAETAAEGEPS